MKKLYFLILVLLCSVHSMCGQVISQYVETNAGSSPKGIEIWNNTSGSINFSVTNLQIWIGTNGATPSPLPGTLINSGNLSPNNVLVIGTADIGTYLSNSGLGSVLFLSYSFSFNGDDVLQVVLGGNIIDVLGNPGVDPGISWLGNGVSTADQNIQLLSGIIAGDIDGWSDPSIRMETASSNPSGIDGLTGFGIAPPIIFSGNGDWNDLSHWNTGVLPSASTSVIINGNSIINNDEEVSQLIINSSMSLTLSSIGKLKINSLLTNNAGISGLILQSDANGTASLIHTSNNIAASINRFITGESWDWHFLSSPIQNQSIQTEFVPDPFTLNEDFYCWYESGGIWVNFKNSTVIPTWADANSDNTFAIGKGYLVAYQETNPTKTFNGNLNNGLQSIQLTKTGSGIYSGLNLVGNPYASSIDWKAATGWVRSNLVSNGGGYDFYIWNQSANNYGVYNSAAGTDAGTNSASRYIGPMQGFIVAANVTGNLILDNNVRVHNNAGTWFKNTEIENNTIRIKVVSENGYGSDEAIIEFGHFNNPGGTTKMFSIVETAPSVYIPEENINYSIRFLTSFSDTYIVPVSFIAGADGDYQIAFSLDQSMFSMIELEDFKTGIRQNLKENAVYYFSSLTGDFAERFALHYSAVGINESDKQNCLMAFVYGERVYITNNLGKAKMQLFDLQGRLVQASQLNGQGLQSQPLNLPAGMYIVRVQNEHAVKSARVVVGE